MAQSQGSCSDSYSSQIHDLNEKIDNLILNLTETGILTEPPFKPEGAISFNNQTRFTLCLECIDQSVIDKYTAEDKNKDLDVLSQEIISGENLLLLGDSFTASRNGNWRSRCGCDDAGTCSTRYSGKSYFTFTNETDRRVILYLAYFKHSECSSVRGPNALRSPYVFDAASRGSAGKYITNVYDCGQNFCTKTLEATICFDVYDASGTNVQTTYRLNPDFEERGEDWLHCGQDFEYILREI